MADSKLLCISMQEDELCCPVCFDEFEEPKALPQCQHNFCKKCLETMVRNQNQLMPAIECPTCRVISVLPEGCVDKLPTNYLLKSLVERIPGRKDKIELTKIIQECERNVTYCKAKYQEKRTSSLKSHEEALQKSLQVRKEICDHAKYLIDIIQERSKMLCFQINNHIAEVSSLMAKYEQCNGNLIGIASKASDYLENVKAVLKRNDPHEISSNKGRIEAEIRKLNESILFQISDANSLDGTPRGMEFRRMNEQTDGDNLFGVLQASQTSSQPTLNAFTPYGQPFHSNYLPAAPPVPFMNHF